MNDDRRAFLDGHRPDDVVIYLAEEAVDDPDRLAAHAETVSDGLVLTLEGEMGRSVFQTATGTDPMAFARGASGVEGTIDPDLTGGTCPDDGRGASDDAGSDDGGGDDAGSDAGGGDDGGAGSGDHAVRFLFAFSEEQKDDLEGLYAEGDVVHAYAQCSCGTAYSQRWIAGDRD